MRFDFENQWMEIPDSIYDSFVEDFDSVIVCARLLNYEIEAGFLLCDVDNGFKKCEFVRVMIYNDDYILTLKFYLDDSFIRNVTKMQVTQGVRGDKTTKNVIIYRQTYRDMTNFFKSVRVRMGGL
ncbi:hypothetical protein D3C81_767770 [compost metagenome]